jgi:tryptophanyl-tRNA synthetase
MAKVTGLDGQKMSKSYGNTINIFGPEKQLRKKIMKIKTDSVDIDEPKDPEASIIYELYQLFASESDAEAMANDFRNGGVGYGDFKKRLWEAYWDYFAPMRARREELLANRDHVDDVLKQGAEKARELASGVLGRVRHAMGL